MKRISLLLSMFLTLLSITILSTASEKNVNANRNALKEEKNRNIIMQIDNKVIEADWENNDATDELKKELTNGDLTIELSKYGGFEQVGDLGKSYSTNDMQITAETGDIMLYSGNKIVIFYGKNTWSYTKLGKIKNLSKDEIVQLLSGKDVILTLKLEQ